MYPSTNTHHLQTLPFISSPCSAKMNKELPLFTVSPPSSFPLPLRPVCLCPKDSIKATLSNIPRGPNLRDLFQFSPAPGSEHPSSLGTHLSPILLQSAVGLALPSQLLSLPGGWLPLWRVWQEEYQWLSRRQSGRRRCGGRKHWVFRAGGQIRNPVAGLWLGGRSPGRHCGGSNWGGPWSVSLRFVMLCNVLVGNEFLLHC